MSESMFEKLVREVFGPGRQDLTQKLRCALVHLHPAQFGLLLLEIQAAKEVRYNAPHPDYHNALSVLASRERAPVQKVARYSESDAGKIFDNFKAELEAMKRGGEVIA